LAAPARHAKRQRRRLSTYRDFGNIAFWLLELGNQRAFGAVAAPAASRASSRVPPSNNAALTSCVHADLLGASTGCGRRFFLSRQV